jgi:cytochrome c oxidase subunit 2
MNRMPPALAPSPARTRRRAFAIAIAASLAGVLALTGVASADFLTPQSGGSPNADDVDTLYKIILAVAVVVFVGVEGALVYSLVKFRVRKDAVPAQIRGNTTLEIGWTLGAAVILVVLAIVTFAMLGGIRTPPNSDADGYASPVVPNLKNASAFQPRPPNGHALNIKVNGQRYVWRYTYPGEKANTPENQKVATYVEMVVPTKTTVVLDIEAQDVAHSWWIPALGGKFDAVPGHTNFTWFKIPKPGVYRGQCAELCGRNHADMIAQVRAVSPADFKAWLATKKTEIEASDAEARTRRAADATEAPGGKPTPGASADPKATSAKTDQSSSGSSSGATAAP